MGFLDIFKGKNKTKKIIIKAPITGRCVGLNEVNDPVFSGKILGDGVAIEPTSSGNMVAPVDGKIVQIFDTLHSFTIETIEGINVLFHFGLDTVSLKGKGFIKVLNEGDMVKTGDVIIKYDLDFIKDKVPSILSPIIVLEPENYKKIEFKIDEDVIEGKTEIIEVEE